MVIACTYVIILASIRSLSLRLAFIFYWGCLFSFIEQTPTSNFDAKKNMKLFSYLFVAAAAFLLPFILFGAFLQVLVMQSTTLWTLHRSKSSESTLPKRADAIADSEHKYEHENGNQLEIGFIRTSYGIAGMLIYNHWHLLYICRSGGKSTSSTKSALNALIIC